MRVHGFGERVTGDEIMGDDHAAQNWWSSVPGVLTASAAAITAIGGLVTVLSQAGVFHSAAPAKPADPAVVSASQVAPAASASAVTIAADTTTNHAAQGTTEASANPPAPSPTPTPAATDGAAALAYFMGTWDNRNQGANVITRVTIRSEGGKILMHVWAKCDAPECDLGESPAQASGGGSADAMRTLTAQFRNHVRDTQVTVYQAPNALIRVDARSDIAGPNGLEHRNKSFLFGRAS